AGKGAVLDDRTPLAEDGPAEALAGAAVLGLTGQTVGVTEAAGSAVRGIAGKSAVENVKGGIDVVEDGAAEAGSTAAAGIAAVAGPEAGAAAIAAAAAAKAVSA